MIFELKQTKRNIEIFVNIKILSFVLNLTEVIKKFPNYQSKYFCTVANDFKLKITTNVDLLSL